MKKNILFLFIVIFSSYLYSNWSYLKIETPEEVSAFFCKTPEEIDLRIQNLIKETTNSMEAILAIADEDKNFCNTVKAIDIILGNFNSVSAMISVLSLVSTDKSIRDLSNANLIKLENFIINYKYDERLYHSLKIISKKFNKNLSQEEGFFLNELIKSLKNQGIEKEKDVRDKIKYLTNELAKATIEFDQNIYSDNRAIEVTLEELKGLDFDFINNLQKTNQGLYVLATDYPTIFKILKECEIETTRKRLWQVFMSKAYPTNENILNKIINLNHDISKLIDYKSYADCSISKKMAGSVERVESFLTNLFLKCKEKADSEIKTLLQDVPETIEVIDGKIKPWDKAFLFDWHKKKNYDLNTNKVAEYFPLDYTLPKLFKIYEMFFGLTFKEVKVEGLWHDTVKSFSVYKDNKLLGTLLLDLFPRENKFNHAGQIAIVKTVKLGNGQINPAVVLLVTNFTKPTNQKPSLLTLSEVNTFFHECGHAIHSLVSSTNFILHSGTSVKSDFVEMPSQMLEFWLKDQEILKMISSHYKTLEPINDDLINKIKNFGKFGRAISLLDQLFLATVSLELFKEGKDKNISEIWNNLQNKIINHTIKTKNFRYCSFGHLNSYGPSYYGYLWSEVYAADLFAKINKHGLLNQEIGQKYIDCILSKGGSADPYDLIKDFLGREPNSDAFFEHLGL